MSDKILMEAFDKLKAIEESDYADEAKRNRKMKRAFVIYKDEMTDKLQDLSDKLLKKLNLSDEDYVWGSAARPYKRGQGFMLATRVTGAVQDIEKYVSILNKNMSADVDEIIIGSIHGADTKTPSAWIRAKFPNKYANLK